MVPPLRRLKMLYTWGLADQYFDSWYVASTECQAFPPVVWTGSPRPLTRKRVLPPPPHPFGPMGGGGGANSRGGDRFGKPNSDAGTDTGVHKV